MEITDPVQCVSYLLTRLADKKPKIPPMCLEIVKEALVMFGVKGFPVKDVIKALPTAFNSSNNLLRDAAMDLTVEMHKWIGKLHSNNSNYYYYDNNLKVLRLFNHLLILYELLRKQILKRN